MAQNNWLDSMIPEKFSNMPDHGRKQVVRWFLSHLACSIVSFHAGSLFGVSSCVTTGRYPMPDPPYQRLKVSGVKSIDRQSLLDTFDMGSPSGKKDVDPILVKLSELMPEQLITREAAPAATKDCDVVKIVQTNSSSCVVVTEGLDEFHVTKWTRDRQSWRPVSRFHGTDFSLKTPPKPISTRLLDQLVSNYSSYLSTTLENLKPIADSLSESAKPIVVMVCNEGHAELLLNFICASRNVGVDLSKYLVFATDENTEMMVKSWGLSVVHYPNIFPEIGPEKAEYGSIPYANAMLSKVICAQLISSLGHDFVFQDVDMVPYRADYVEHFVSLAGKNDVLFQYDHSEDAQYQPWSANSGFYYVRSNVKTKYLFTSLLRQSDMILRSKSHQAVLNILLSEHSSLFGLKVKVLHEESDMFPGRPTPFSIRIVPIDTCMHSRLSLSQREGIYETPHCGRHSTVCLSYELEQRQDNQT